ncbi:hypothetical protein [Nonomuraea typhae]|uniref:hypothetical protein n=1 Tax=Nonomuraea typhae TaxID=2603600 RepID=UPI0012F70BCD|nr:hypothetical protein [Nonomuraea typhae]
MPDDGRFPVERKWAWQLQLTAQAETALMAGLRAYDEAGGELTIHGEHGVLTLSGPPRAISLYVLAARFAALSHNALRDPAGAVAGLMKVLVEVGQPGVLHLSGPVGAEVLAAVREVTGELGSWYGDAALGYVSVVAPGDDENTLMIDLGKVADRHRAGEPMREVVQRLIDDGEVTWARPPVGEQRRLVLR